MLYRVNEDKDGNITVGKWGELDGTQALYTSLVEAKSKKEAEEKYRNSL